MDVERAQVLADHVHEYVQDMVPLVYDTYNWDEVSDVPLRPDVTKDDSNHIGEAEQALGAAGRSPGLTKVMMPDESRGKWVDHGTVCLFEWYDGKPTWVESEVFFPSLTLTEGLARARRHLNAVSACDAPELRAAVQEALRLVDGGLSALGLTPDDPVVLAAGKERG
jgi:hypothetical protein